jgi:hypothetical protein
LQRHPEIRFPGGKELHFWNGGRGPGALEAYLDQFADDASYNGEITPAYAMLPLPVIREIHAAIPYVQLIYLIRNPKDRAWSSACMALRRAEMDHADASDQWFIDHFNSKGSVARGDYETCLKNWRSVFPDKQLLIATHDDLLHDPVGLANRCLVHVGLEPFFSAANHQELSSRVFPGDGAELRPSLRKMLSTMYDDKILSLQHYLDVDLSHWRGAEW